MTCRGAIDSAASIIVICLIANATVALAQDSSRQFAAVVCISEATGPWNAKARGTLTRTKSKDELIYHLKVDDQSFSWRFVTNAQGATTATGPGYLLDRFGAGALAPDPADRRQTLYASGEIREFAPQSALLLAIGSKCPAARR